VLVRIGKKHAEFVQALRQRGVLVRDRHSDPGCEGCVRLTVGSGEHTRALIAALHDVIDKVRLRPRCRYEKSDTSSQTTETEIDITLKIEGRGKYDVSTGIRF